LIYNFEVLLKNIGQYFQISPQNLLNQNIVYLFVCFSNKFFNPFILMSVIEK